jgi:hypothetical protein
MTSLEINLILKVYTLLHTYDHYSINDFTKEQQLNLINELRIKINFRTVRRIFIHRKWYIKEALNIYLNKYMINNRNSLTKEMVVEEALIWIQNINWINDNDIISYFQDLVQNYRNSNRQLPPNISNTIKWKMSFKIIL